MPHSKAVPPVGFHTPRPVTPRVSEPARRRMAKSRLSVSSMARSSSSRPMMSSPRTLQSTSCSKTWPIWLICQRLLSFTTCAPVTSFSWSTLTLVSSVSPSTPTNGCPSTITTLLFATRTSVRLKCLLTSTPFLITLTTICWGNSIFSSIRN